jgi:hypothetical protein
VRYALIRDTCLQDPGTEVGVVAVVLEVGSSDSPLEVGEHALQARRNGLPRP